MKNERIDSLCTAILPRRNPLRWHNIIRFHFMDRAASWHLRVLISCNHIGVDCRAAVSSR